MQNIKRELSIERKSIRRAMKTREWLHRSGTKREKGVTVKPQDLNQRSYTLWWNEKDKDLREEMIEKSHFTLEGKGWKKKPRIIT